MHSGAPPLIVWLHPALWIAWLVYWKISARGVKPVARQETLRQRLSHFGPIWAAALLFSFPKRFPLLGQHVFPPNAATFLVGTVILIAGLLFSVWARVALGKNWSAEVTVKEDHELVENGPYRWVRHPIYTGILAGLLGSAIAQDRWASFVAVALVFVGFWFKLLREEAWMRETFGERYAAYGQRTARLLPFVL
jgi:protein-S-isoprenylcysteine O-methyltransferase Ste14